MPHPSGIPYCNLEVLRSVASSNEVGYKFKFTAYDNNVNPDNFRIQVYFMHPWSPSDLQTDVYTGFEKYGGLTGGTLYVDTPVDIMEYLVPTHPLGITEPISASGFRNLFRFRLSGANFDNGGGARDYLNDGEGIGGLEVRLRQTSYKNYYQLGGLYSYERAYSNESSSSYVNSTRFVLQYNAIDPSNPDSHNWKIVPEVTDNIGTPDVNTGAYPDIYIPDYELYASDAEAGYPRIGWATTEQNILLLPATGDAMLDSANPSTNYSSAQTTFLASNYWNGSAISNRREVWSFDSSVIFGKSIESIIAICWLTGANINANGNNFELHDMNAPVDESTATWNNLAGQFGANLGSYVFPANTNDARESYASWSLSSLPSEATNNVYLGLKWTNESVYSESVIGTRRATSPDERPYIAIKFDPDSGGNTGSGNLTLPSISVLGAGQKMLTNDGSGILSLPKINALGAGSVFRVLSGSGILSLPSVDLNGSGIRNTTVFGGGNISLPSVAVAGLGSINSVPVISYISYLEGRWDELVQMTIENLPVSFAITLDGIEVEIVSVNGNDVVWKVPRIPIGPRKLRIVEL